MEDPQPSSRRIPKDDSIDLAAQARSLRRTIVFWRRLAWLVLALALIVVVVAWQRTTVRCRECQQSLQQYGKTAVDLRLDREPAEVFEAQWQQLGKNWAGFSAGHYELLVQNWLRTPAPGEVIPLAVCRDSHVAFFLGRGRHVLFREPGKPVNVKWLSEEEARPLLERVRRAHGGND
jgi:hypothetical protein